MSSFAFMPRELLSHPPVAHHDSTEDLLSPWELAVVAGLLTCARLALNEQNHVEALKGGAATIALEKTLDQEFKEDWRNTHSRRRRGEQAQAPRRSHTFSTEERYKPVRRSFKSAGKHGYQQAKAKARKQPPPDVITVKLSRSYLLTVSGHADDGDSLRQLDAALKRLCNPILIAGAPKAPLLRQYQRTSSGLLRLRVAGEWLMPPYLKVPMPLPSRSPSGLALYLFLHTINTSATNIKDISLDSLCRRLGIDKRGRRLCRQAWTRALAVVNQHLRKHEGDVREYKFKEIDDGKGRFVAIKRQYLPEDEPMTTTPKVKRVPLISRKELNARIRARLHEIGDL
jgi:hypothetical protein